MGGDIRKRRGRTGCRRCGSRTAVGHRRVLEQNMTSLLVTNIGELTTWDTEHPVLTDAAFIVDGGTIAWLGRSHEAPAADAVDAVGKAAAIPGFVDSHSHLVFAGYRSADFAARMAGQPYRVSGTRTPATSPR